MMNGLSMESRGSTSCALPDMRLKKQRQLSGYTSDDVVVDDDEEIDETFLALQKLLKALNGTRQPPSSATVVPASTTTMGNNNGTGVGPRVVVVGSNSSSNNTSTNHRLSAEELLECRRQERERFRHMLLSKNQRRCPTYYYYEDDEDDDEPTMSVESTISNRVISGSFSRLNVRVISRDRWAKEEVERLPIVLLPKNGKVVSPTENPKLNVVMTKEHAELQSQLLDRLCERPELVAQGRFLTPPRATWYIQMRDMDGIEC